MRQSTIFYAVAVLVLIWFAAETATIGAICATSCTSPGSYNWAIVVIAPILIVLLGLNQRRNENNASIKKTTTTTTASNEKVSSENSTKQKEDVPDSKGSLS